MLELMRQYNKAIESWKRAEEYFKREDVTLEQKLSREDDCKNLVNHLDGLIHKIKDEGYKMTDEEISEGFRQFKFLEERGHINVHTTE